MPSETMKLMIPPAVEPVDLATMKTYARVDQASDDTLISNLILTARQWCEAYTRRAFIAQVWEYELKAKEAGSAVLLPRPPFLSLISVRVADEDGTMREEDKTAFLVTERSGQALLTRCDHTALVPSGERLIVTYEAGYGPAAGDVPATLRLAVQQMALHWYENRAVSSAGGVVGRLPLLAESLLSDYRILSAGAPCV